MSRDINNKFWNEELETLPREELQKRQLEDLKEIVKFAYDNAPYYKRSFDEAGVKPEVSLLFFAFLLLVLAVEFTDFFPFFF